MLRKIIKISHYFKLSALIVIISGFAVSAATDPLKLINYFGSGFSHAIGVSTTVKPNPYNALALQLSEKENLLEAQKIDLQRREEAFDDELDFQKKLIFTLSAAVVLLFILVVVNFVLDLKRKTREKIQWNGQR